MYKGPNINYFSNYVQTFCSPTQCQEIKYDIDKVAMPFQPQSAIQVQNYISWSAMNEVPYTLIKKKKNR